MITFAEKNNKVINYKITDLNCKISEIPESLFFLLNKNTTFKIPYPSVYSEQYSDGVGILSSIFNNLKIEESTEEDQNNLDAEYSFVGASLNSSMYEKTSFKESDIYLNFINEIKKYSQKIYKNYYLVNSDYFLNHLDYEEYEFKILEYAELFFSSLKIQVKDINQVISHFFVKLFEEESKKNKRLLNNLFTKNNKILLSDLHKIEKRLPYLNLESNYKFEINKKIANDSSFSKIVKKYTNLEAIDLFNIFNAFLKKQLKYKTNSNGIPLVLLCPYNLDTVEISKRFNRVKIVWSNVQTKSINFGTTYLKEQIRHRYFLQDRPTSGSLNTIIDSFLPSALYNCNMDSEKVRRQYSYTLSKNSYAISPYVSNLFGIKKVDQKQLCKILGFDEKKIKSMLMSIKLKKLDFVFVGAGGTGINTAIWLKEMCDFSNITGLFNRVYCFDEDEVEISNLLRFPIDPHSIIIDETTPTGAVISNTSKLHLIKHAIMQLSSSTSSLVTKFICKDENTLSDFPSSIFVNNMETIVKDDGDFETINRFRTRENVVLYGAPDIATRVNLSKAGRFISATHATNSCNVYINPSQDASIQVESYGMIQLSPFFMNQLRMAISLLEILSDDNLNDLLSEQDKSILQYSFNGESVLKTDRVYNFNIDKRISMMTEDEALNAGN